MKIKYRCCANLCMKSQSIIQIKINENGRSNIFFPSVQYLSRMPMHFKTSLLCTVPASNTCHSLPEAFLLPLKSVWTSYGEHKNCHTIHVPRGNSSLKTDVNWWIIISLASHLFYSFFFFSKSIFEAQPLPSSGDLPNTGIKPGSPALQEKAMAPHSSTLAWKIPWMAEPGRLQSMRSLRVGHD